ncbi:Mpv17/PMP22 family protein [Peptostreptococcus canis]|uniref:Mpv17/PMP22 family protein n=1 Tax=Peptostreptococcus canis TaxID=1159213 RepID=A0ABR6TLQ5_9FIRM|nr:Mpv17/PMP22 family protein [Peptostreptococcus canis]MBC2576351.1 Mpv17/PMP22 family protein [Peptostreptococcus canis]MBP1998550.1 FtsH-binding integral membrane protein [Peptostreptococcus canis]
MSFLTNHYVLSFIKFAILATLGEIIASSIRAKKLTIPHSIGYRMLIWGLLGVWIAFMMGLFAKGVGVKLADSNSAILHTKFAFAFITSLVMNTSFGPVFMVLHKHTDTYLDLRYENTGEKITLQKICSKIDYYAYAKNVLIGTIPTFWLPAHTITFLLPEGFRVFFAALLSICLGIILSLKSK